MQGLARDRGCKSVRCYGKDFSTPSGFLIDGCPARQLARSANSRIIPAAQSQTRVMQKIQNVEQGMCLTGSLTEQG